MKIVVIGAVAAGTSAAAKARRGAPDAQITVYDRDSDISYSGCVLPYYIGGMINNASKLTPRDSAYFKSKYDIDVKTHHEVSAIDRDKKTVTVRNLKTGGVFEDTYDKLVIATGASSFIPDIPGAAQDHVFALRSVRDAIAIRSFLQQKKPGNVVIAGSGSIGLELLDNLPGIGVTLVELAPQIAPAFDADMATALEVQLRAKGTQILTSRRIEKIGESHVALDGGQTMDADMVVIAAGVRPNSAFAGQAGIALGFKGAIKVDETMCTSDPDIYACGDCAETVSAITGQPAYFPLGSTANKTGRIVGDVITGGSLRYRGSLGTGIFKVFDFVAGLTGLTEKAAIAQGYDIVTMRHSKIDRYAIFDGTEMDIKAVADRKTRRLLGVQIIGKGGVDTRIDVFASMIANGARADDLFHLDLAYAPPFATAKDPVHYTGMLLTAAHDKRG